MLKQPSSAAAASASTPATAAGAAHPASLRQAHPASLSSAGGAASGAAQEQGGDGSSVGKSKSRRDSRRGSSFSQSVVNRLGEGSIVGSVISKAAELVDDAAYNIVEKAQRVRSSALDATEIDEAVMGAASNIQKMWRGKEAQERVERIRVEVEMTNEAEVCPSPNPNPNANANPNANPNPNQVQFLQSYDNPTLVFEARQP